MIQHMYEGIELDLKYMERTIPYVYRLWGKPIHLQTIVEGKTILFSYDGKKLHRRFL